MVINPTLPENAQVDYNLGVIQSKWQGVLKLEKYN